MIVSNVDWTVLGACAYCTKCLIAASSLKFMTEGFRAKTFLFKKGDSVIERARPEAGARPVAGPRPEAGVIAGAGAGAGAGDIAGGVSGSPKHCFRRMSSFTMPIINLLFSVRRHQYLLW